MIKEGGDRLLGIINDIISVSKIESGEMSISLSETDINEQLRFIFQFFQPVAKQKGIILLPGNVLPRNDAKILTDREKLLGVLTNLVKNAIKFTNHGTVEIGSEKNETLFKFFVKDSGIGIHPDQMKIIFDRFMQGDHSLTRESEGAGLGLSICKAYVELLGGSLWAESEVALGSTFYFTIPVDPPRARPGADGYPYAKYGWYNRHQNYQDF